MTTKRAYEALRGNGNGDDSIPDAVRRRPRGRRGGRSTASNTDTQPDCGAAEGTDTQHAAADSDAATPGGTGLPLNGASQEGQMPVTAPGKDADVRPTSTPTVTSPQPQGPVPVEGQLLPPSRLPSSDGAPANNQDLILKMWNSLTWDKTGQVSVIIVVFGITVALLFWGLGQLAHVLIGTPTMWSAIGGVVAGSGTGAVTYGVARRRQRRRDEDDRKSGSAGR